MRDSLYDIGYYFLFMLNQLKMMHWSTKIYAAHQALDQLYNKMNGHIDRFMEVLQGKMNQRVTQPYRDIERNITVRSYEPKEFLLSMINFLNKPDFIGQIEELNTPTDLLNIRDEMLADINQTLYLLSFQ